MSVLRGRIVSGMGNFSFWIAKLHGFYRSKTGMDLFPGTLNVQFDHPYSLPANVTRLEGSEYGGRNHLPPFRVLTRGGQL